MQISSLLNELGYSPLSTRYDELLSKSIQKVLSSIGTSSYKDLLEQIRSSTGMSEPEILSSAHLLESALKRTLGNVTGNIIIDMIKEELTRIANLNNISYSLDEILKKINENGIYKFVRDISSYEHILVLYKDREMILKILSDFFSNSPNCICALVSSKPTELKNVKNITYEKLSENGKLEAVNNLSDWIKRLFLENKTIKIADEDCTWYLKNDLGMEHLKLEASLGSKPSRKIIALCAYDISKISESDMRSIIQSHGYVILHEIETVLYKLP